MFESFRRMYGGKKRDGFFIEAGAFDGFALSNSLFFEMKRNWTGENLRSAPLHYKNHASIFYLIAAVLAVAAKKPATWADSCYWKLCYLTRCCCCCCCSCSCCCCCSSCCCCCCSTDSLFRCMVLHGPISSNSCSSGLLVEPNPRHFKKMLLLNRRAWAFPRCLSTKTT